MVVRRKDVIMKKILEEPGITGVDLTDFINNETPLKIPDHPSWPTQFVIHNLPREVTVKRNGRKGAQFFPADMGGLF